MSLNHATSIEYRDSPFCVKKCVLRQGALDVSSRSCWYHVSCRNLLIVCTHIMLANYVIQLRDGLLPPEALCLLVRKLSDRVDFHWRYRVVNRSRKIHARECAWDNGLTC